MEIPIMNLSNCSKKNQRKQAKNSPHSSSLNSNSVTIIAPKEKAFSNLSGSNHSDILLKISPNIFLYSLLLPTFKTPRSLRPVFHSKNF